MITNLILWKAFFIGVKKDYVVTVFMLAAVVRFGLVYQNRDCPYITGLSTTYQNIREKTVEIRPNHSGISYVIQNSYNR